MRYIKYFVRTPRLCCRNVQMPLLNKMWAPTRLEPLVRKKGNVELTNAASFHAKINNAWDAYNTCRICSVALKITTGSLLLLKNRHVKRIWSFFALERVIQTSSDAAPRVEWRGQIVKDLVLNGKAWNVSSIPRLWHWIKREWIFWYYFQARSKQHTSWKVAENRNAPRMGRWEKSKGRGYEAYKKGKLTILSCLICLQRFALLKLH